MSNRVGPVVLNDIFTDGRKIRYGRQIEINFFQLFQFLQTIEITFSVYLLFSLVFRVILIFSLRCLTLVVVPLDCARFLKKFKKGKTIRFIVPTGKETNILYITAMAKILKRMFWIQQMTTEVETSQMQEARAGLFSCSVFGIIYSSSPRF